MWSFCKSCHRIQTIKEIYKSTKNCIKFCITLRYPLSYFFEHFPSRSAKKSLRKTIHWKFSRSISLCFFFKSSKKGYDILNVTDLKKRFFKIPIHLLPVHTLIFLFFPSHHFIIVLKRKITEIGETGDFLQHSEKKNRLASV